MPKVVVIVDDSVSIASSIAIALETQIGVRTIVAHHPGAALRVFDTEPTISAVVTDLSLPSFDGFELIKALRQLPGYRELPALMITAEYDPESFNTSDKSRPNVILRKPISFKEVCRVVESLLK